MSALRNRLIGLAFNARIRLVRLRRVLAGLGRPHLRGVDHVTIAVTDLAEARRFYCDLLGATLMMTVDDATFARFGRPPAPNGGEGAHHLSVYLGGATRVDLFLQHAGQPAPTIGHPHYAFQVAPGALLGWRARLAAAGVRLDGPLQLGPPGQASLYFNDPFGNHLELTCLGFTGEVEQRPPNMAVTAAA
ncbi:MAG: VOC family protein [Alphaproteobacteria bacterium]|nr:VOC family protein [Alphaproteobacteria bacterium]MBV8412974.1 VOC family protein [Alphaproteobacteria bacterium]